MKTLLHIIVIIAGIISGSNYSFAQIQSHSFSYEGNIRYYLVFLPQGYNGFTNFPVVFNLHGYDDTAQIQMDYSMMNAVADTAGFIVVYPDAVNKRWNSGISDNTSWPTPNIDDVGFINALIDTLNNQYSIDSSRIYSCGWSNGGIMSYKLACELNHRIAAIASVSGIISTNTLTNCTPFRSIPVLQMHGTADIWVPINGASGWQSVDQTLSYWINSNNCVQVDTTILPDLDPNDNCTVEKISYTNCTNNSNVIYYKVINGGHTWPGTTFYVPSLGNVNRDINANSEILNFFKGFSLPVSIETNYSPILTKFFLSQNYPNPFNPSTTIEFVLPKSSDVRIEVYNIAGQKVHTLLNKKMSAGSHHIKFNAQNLSSGVYLYRIETGEFQDVKKMLLIK